MPPRKREKPVLPDFKEASPQFEFNSGFRYGLSDNPPQLGEIPTPVGSADCLNGITFTITGTLPSLTREDAKALIERHGGRVTSAISGLTDVVLRGCIEVGPKKLADAKAKNIRIIDQQSLFDYLSSTNPGYAPPPPPRIKGGVSLPTDNFPISSLLTEKYRPRLLEEIVGNLSGIKHLIKFLDGFENNDKVSVILSGPPGIGKSTCAALVALYKGYTPIEFNASDTRSKKSIGEDLSDVFSNKAISGESDKHCLIFDEIDGMSTGDRGGLQELVKMIDSSQIPVICICNDRNNKKFQTLANHSVDIKFSKPIPEDICSRLKEIVLKEKMNISDTRLLEIARAANGDIRHAINTLQFWLQVSDDDRTNDDNATDEEMKKKKMTAEEEDGKIVLILDVVDACQKALMPQSTIDQRFECYFVDYGIMPLYVYENLPVVDRHSYLEAIDSITISDTIQNAVRENNSWNLLNADALFSTVIPGEKSKGKQFGVSVMFPKWLGKNSKMGKLKRYYREIAGRSVKNLTSSPEEMYSTTTPLLAMKFKEMLKGKKPDPEEFVEFLDNLGLTLDDYEHVFELVTITDDPKLKNKIPVTPKVKAAVTRCYHSHHTDNQKKILKESDVRSDYYISSRPTNGRFSKSKTRKYIKHAGDGEDDYDETEYEDEYEYDGEWVVEGNTKTANASKGKTSKTKGTTKTNKTTKAYKDAPAKGKRKTTVNDSSDEDSDEDPGSEMDDFIVEDDEVIKEKEIEIKPKKSTKSSNSKKSSFKPTQTVRRKQKKSEEKEEE